MGDLFPMFTSLKSIGCRQRTVSIEDVTLKPNQRSTDTHYMYRSCYFAFRGEVGGIVT